MPLSRLDNFLKNVRGNILYVNPNDLDATDAITNQGNSMGQPFLTIQRALIEAARFSYQAGLDNDRFAQTTIVLGPGNHVVDNRPGWIPDGTNNFRLRNGTQSSDLSQFTIQTNFDVNDPDNSVYKLNSIYGGVIVPRGTSIVSDDIKKTKIIPTYVPDPENDNIERSAIFRVTGGSYFSNFSIVDANQFNTAFKDYSQDKYTPLFSHHKLTAFEYVDGVNNTRLDDSFQTFFTERTDLDMYYQKIGIGYGDLSGRPISPDYPDSVDINPKIDEYRIVGPISGEVGVTSVRSGDGTTPSNTVVVTLEEGIQGLDVDTDFEISGVSDNNYNGSFKVFSVLTEDAEGDTTSFTYEATNTPANALPPVSGATVVLDSDTTTGSSPYFENITLRSTFGMCGAHADGKKVIGFKSMLFNQFTTIGLQKDNNAFVKFNTTSGSYDDSSAIDNIHSDAQAKYKPAYYNYSIKASNEAFCQIISSFAIGYSRQYVTETGGEISLANVNSNFGQTALSSTGFRETAFQKDDVGYLTSLIPPREIAKSVINLEYDAIDVTATLSVANTRRLYLFQQTNQDSPPRSSLQGYIIGAKNDEYLNVQIPRDGVLTNYFAKVLMPNTQIGSNPATGKKVSTVSRDPNTGNSIVNNTITLDENHQFLNGETIRVISDNGRLPDGLDANQIYFAITDGVSANQIKIAKTSGNAANGVPLSINNLGGELIIESRVSDKITGGIGHPIQYDTTTGQWYITVSTTGADNTIYPTLAAMAPLARSGGGTGLLGDATPRTFIVRTPDNRTLEDKIYKARYVIPANSGITSAREPRQSFVIQSSNDVTGATDTEVALQFNPGSVSMTNLSQMRNFSFLRNAEWTSGIVTYTTELPHKLTTGSQVLIENVKSTSNTTGIAGSAFNGTFIVDDVKSSTSFTVQGTSYDSGTFTSNTSNRVVTLPTFKRIKANTNLYIYNVEKVRDYISGEQDGIYNLTVVSSNNTPRVAPFNDEEQFAFSQQIRNLFPQLDRDNPESDPKATQSYALPDTLGSTVVDEPKNSLSKEAFQSNLYDFGVGVGITDIVSNSAGTAHTIHTTHDHGLSKVTKLSISAAGAGYGNGTGGTEYLYNAVLTNSATGENATAVITINASGGITAAKVMNGGTNYRAGDVLTVTGTATTTGFSAGTVTVDNVYNNIGESVSISGVSSDSYSGYNSLYLITGISSTNAFEVSSRLAISNVSTSGIGSTVSSRAFMNLTGESQTITSLDYTNSTGIGTITVPASHGFQSGEKVFIGGADDDFFNDGFLVTEVVGINTFSVNVGITTLNPATTGDKRYYRPLLTSRGGSAANRLISQYSGISTVTSGAINDTTTSINISNVDDLNLQIGDFLQIDDEIMRIKSTVSANPVSVFRGVHGTIPKSHVTEQRIRKIESSPIEFRKSSTIKSTSHTFEYVGYGPGNYSTALPDRQDDEPDAIQQILAQSLKSNAGNNVYTGMNDTGDFYIGNKRISSLTGAEDVFDTPVPTVTGRDIFSNELDAGVDIINPLEATVNRALKVEGGDTGNVLSEFNGPVVFSKKITSTSDEGVEANNIFLQGDTTISRKYTVGISTPILSGNPGDVVFNANPESGGTIGWTYTVENDWYPFGNISSVNTENQSFFANLGIGTDSFSSVPTPTLQVGSGSSIFVVDGNGVGIGTTANDSKLSVDGVIKGTFVGDGSGITNLPVDSKWTDNVGLDAIYPVDGKSVGIGTTNPNALYNLHLGSTNTGQTDLFVENGSRFDGIVSINSDAIIGGTLRVDKFELSGSTSGIITSNTLRVSNLQAGTLPTNLLVGDTVSIGTDAKFDGKAEFTTYHESVQNVSSSSGQLTIDLSLGQTFTITLTEDVTSIVVINPPSGSTSFTLKIEQPPFNNYSITMSNFLNNLGGTIGVNFPGGIIPTVTPADSAEDIYSFMTFNGGVSFYGVVGGQQFSTEGGVPSEEDGLSYNSITKTVGVSSNLSVEVDTTIGGNLTVNGSITASSNGNLTVAVGASVFYGNNDAIMYHDGSNLYLDYETANTSSFIIRNSSDTNIFTFSNDGNLTATGNVQSNSDERIKTNIRPLEDPLAKVIQLRGVMYDRTDIESNDNIGMIAQEVESVIPQLVSETNGVKSLAYSNMVAVLVEAIKDQQKQIDALREEIRNLK